VQQGTIVGQSGIEWSYDRYLRGEEGATRVQVDALGRQKGPPLRTRQPVQGKQLKLSLDFNLQDAAQQAIKTIGGGNPGAFVAMDPRSGEILALGSYPSFDPNIFSKPVKESTLKKLQSTANGAPLYDRAIAGLYPTGSTFKVITTWPALQTGTITPDTVIDDPARSRSGTSSSTTPETRPTGAVALRRRSRSRPTSSSTRMGGAAEWRKRGTPAALRAQLGIGRRTGIDLPGEFEGLLPTPQWRDRLFQGEQDGPPVDGGRQRQPRGRPGRSAVHATADGHGLLDGVNGGRVPRPHVGHAHRGRGRAHAAAHRAPPRPHVKISRKPPGDPRRPPRAASAGGRHVSDVFAGFPH
jgi:penicillin-binding protein 2